MINFIDKFLNINVFSEVWPFLLEGLLVTVELAIITLVTSMIVGLIAALLKISRIKIVSQIVSAYINVFRGTPLLVQIIIIFYALPLCVSPPIKPLFHLFCAPYVWNS
jgi:His/Glu/Gln/Arg/opine family amino acid ABC transporter permease subunit